MFVIKKKEYLMWYTVIARHAVKRAASHLLYLSLRILSD